MLSELAQHVINARAQLHSWAIETYPGHIKMPSDIFKAIPTKEIAQDVSIGEVIRRAMSLTPLFQIQRTVYLSPQLIEGLGTLGKPVKMEIKVRIKECFLVLL